MLKLGALNRWQAAAGHLVLSAVIGVSVFAAMILVWYTPPYFEAAGGNDLVLLLLGVDITLGPLLTLAVFNPGKGMNKLRFDLAVIATLQLAALAYGVHVMFTARPAYLVFAVDRFDLVMANLLTDAELAKAQPPWNARPVGRPPTVGARVPDDPKLKDESLFIALAGIDLPQQPRFFVPYEEIAAEAAKRAQPLADLRALNPDERARIDEIVRRSGRAEANLAFLAARAPNLDFVVIVDRSTGAVIDKAMLKPWKTEKT
ncbi:MAG TPA: TfpX/TfpZ family type IV pilin accessory protein [Casimicrobiaceae bacterium]|nr:TfpX/TfpZ family type IV pilin accessory protein [Casimicrobiaceae bacterium]